MTVSVSNLISYEWYTSESFLIHSVDPNRILISAELDDDPKLVIKQLTGQEKYFLFHINCTKTERFPRLRQELLEQLKASGMMLLNDHLTDISKRTVQKCCRDLGLNSTLATREGDPSEAVMVKSNLNFAGKTESGLSDADREFLGLGSQSQLIWDPYHYVVKRRDEIEDALWDDENHICETYIENSDDKWYRAYVVMDRIVLCEMTNSLQVKKVGESKLVKVWSITVTGDQFEEVSGKAFPEQMVRDLVIFQRGFHLDFGTIDIVVSDTGAPYIIDINSTPAYNNEVDDLADHLRQAF